MTPTNSSRLSSEVRPISKLVANTVGIMSVGIILQGAVGYLLLSYVNGAALPIATYVTAMGLLTLYTLFYISATLMLGSFFSTRGPVLGIAMMLVFQDFLGQIIDSIIKGFTSILPNRLVGAADAVILGNPIPSIVPVASTAIFVVLFVGLSLWRFNQTEC